MTESGCLAAETLLISAVVPTRVAVLPEIKNSSQLLKLVLQTNKFPFGNNVMPEGMLRIVVFKYITPI